MFLLGRHCSSLSGSESNAVINSMFNSSTMDPVAMFLAGYNDCMEEAVRYLTDVEKLSLDDPLVTGLQKHLMDHQSNLDESSILNRINMEVENNQQAQSNDIEHNEADCETQSQPLHLNYGALSVQLGNLSRHNSDSIDIALQNATHDDERTEVSPNEGYAPLSLPQILENNNSDEDSEMSANAYSLAMLAQSNPAIASLTEELMMLLENVPSAMSENSTIADQD